jgi:hypothetical protein
MTQKDLQDFFSCMHELQKKAVKVIHSERDFKTELRREPPMEKELLEKMDSHIICLNDFRHAVAKLFEIKYKATS